MHHVNGTPREQLTLLPEAVGDYIHDENPVRFVEAFVESLNLTELGFQKTELPETGRPPYCPADLLKLYIYGYLNRIRSSRRLERETKRNLEVMWLLKKLSPDHKTISNFRKDNRSALRLVCRQFVALCQHLDLFGAELVAIDGSKFAASNANRKNFTKARLREHVLKIDSMVESYLDALDAGDAQEAPLSVEAHTSLKEKIGSLQQRSREYHQLLSNLDDSGASQVSLTDPDSRMMDNHGQRDVSYNVQTAVDSKHKLIVEHEVTNEPNERTLLALMAKRTKETLRVESLDVCADKGYWSGTQIKECDDANIATFIPEHASTGKRKSNIPTPDFAPARFVYDEENDSYLCPQGQQLKLTTKTWVHNRWRFEYRTSACAKCLVRDKCTADKGGRRIYRSELEGTLQAARNRVATHPEKAALRKTLSEHPFGTLKHAWGHKAFLTRGLDNVKAEMSLSILAYNMRRVISILGVPTMLNQLACP
jgi:transposase